MPIPLRIKCLPIQILPLAASFLPPRTTTTCSSLTLLYLAATDCGIFCHRCVLLRALITVVFSNTASLNCWDSLRSMSLPCYALTQAIVVYHRTVKSSWCSDEDPPEHLPGSCPEALPVCPLNVVTRLQDSCSSLSMVTCPEWSPTNTCRVSTSNLKDKCWGKHIIYTSFAFLSWLTNSFNMSILQSCE